MRLTVIAAMAALTMAAGCETGSVAPDLEQIESDLNNRFTFAPIERAAYRSYAAAYSEMPFAEGAMSIVAAEQGEMRTYRLVPCGETVCGGSAHGPAGRVETTADYVIVSGLYGRQFWLSPGGDGALIRSDGATVSLAWDSI